MHVRTGIDALRFTVLRSLEVVVPESDTDLSMASWMRTTPGLARLLLLLLLGSAHMGTTRLPCPTPAVTARYRVTDKQKVPTVAAA